MPEQHRGHAREARPNTIVVHARAAPGRMALCGDVDPMSRSTRRRSEVTCAGCLREIVRRLGEQLAKRPRR